MYSSFSLCTHSLSASWRRVRRDPLSMIVHVFGLSIGLAVFILAVGYFTLETSFDSFHTQADRIVRLIYEQHFPNQVVNSAVSPAPAGPALTESYSEVENYCRFSRLFGDVLLAHEDRRFYENGGVYADASFFKMFSFPLIRGEASKALTHPTGLVLTASLAQKYFGDKDPMDKIVTMEGGLTFTVTGVMEDVPVNSHLQFDFIIPFEIQRRWGSDLESWGNWGNQFTYLLLRDKDDYVTLAGKIENMVVDQLPDHPHRLKLQRLESIHLARGIEYDGYAIVGDQVTLGIVLLVAVLVLIISAINAMNLATIRALRRDKEAGLRKVMGAGRHSLGFHFGVESMALTGLALLLSVLWVSLCLPLLQGWIDLPFSSLLSQKSLWLGVLLGVTITAGGAGIYPAWLFGRLMPQHLIRGHAPKVHRRWGLRESMVILQFVLSVGLIVFMLTVQSQVRYMESQELGFDKSSLIYTQMRGNIRQNFNVLKTRLLQLPGVESVTGGGSFNSVYAKTTDEVEWPGKKESDSQTLYTAVVDFDFLRTFDINLKEGRDFMESRSTDKDQAFLINEEARRVLELENPLESTLTFNGETGQVIGVIEDYHFLPLQWAIAPLIMSVRQEWREFIFIRLVPGNNAATLEEIHQIWDSMAPNIPCDIKYWDVTYAEGYRPQRILAQLFKVLAAMAILLACLGLFGLASYAVDQRRKEVAVRKVLGASSGQLVGTLLSDFIKQIVVAILIAWPIAAWGCNQWLSSYANRIGLQWPLFLLSGFMAIAISILTVGSLAIAAARTLPTVVLRQDL